MINCNASVRTIWNNWQWHVFFLGVRESLCWIESLLSGCLINFLFQFLYCSLLLLSLVSELRNFLWINLRSVLRCKVASANFGSLRGGRSTDANLRQPSGNIRYSSKSRYWLFAFLRIKRPESSASKLPLLVVKIIISSQDKWRNYFLYAFSP